MAAYVQGRLTRTPCRRALQNAASVATLLLTSDALIAEKPKKEGKKAAAGHGGDYDMY